MNAIVVEQGSEEWKKLRAGKITASRFAELLAKNAKGQPLKARADLLTDLVLERYTGEPSDSISAKALLWGSDVEGFGRVAYEAEKGVIVERVAFIEHPTIAYLGASPDGLISDDGGLELKCPITKKVHLETLLYGMPKEHEPQVQGNLFCSGRKWWEFASFHPKFPPESRLFIQRVYPDAKMHAEIEQAAADLNDEIVEWVERLQRKYRKEAA